MIKIKCVGGYNEVGKNMTAVKVGDEAVILDMGLHLENYIKYTQDEDILKINPDELIEVGAFPDIKLLKSWQKNIKAIIPTHAHLDHIGAIPYLSGFYDAKIIGTPFAMAVLRQILSNEKISIPNSIINLNPNSKHKLSKNIEIEFIHMTHSTPQTVMVAIHTPEGTVVYANDFKFDRYPQLGDKPNFKKLKELGEKGVLALIVDSTYAKEHKKMPSESVAKELLRDVLLGTNSTGKAVIVTTFSSHLARLKSILEFGKKMNRKIIFLGRSLSRYTEAGEEVGIINFSDDVEIVKYAKHIKRRLKQVVEEGKEKYLLVVTGHQGEPKAALSKMVRGELGFKFGNEDHVVFSCTVIPTPTNKENRHNLESDLKAQGARIFRDIHVSGHAAREDLRDLINLLKPEHIIPAHGDQNMTSAMAELAKEMKYEIDKTVHVMKNGGVVRL